jgi:hypothetical protein
MTAALIAPALYAPGLLLAFGPRRAGSPWPTRSRDRPLPRIDGSSFPASSSALSQVLGTHLPVMVQLDLVVPPRRPLDTWGTRSGLHIPLGVGVALTLAAAVASDLGVGEHPTHTLVLVLVLVAAMRRQYPDVGRLADVSADHSSPARSRRDLPVVLRGPSHRDEELPSLPHGAPRRMPSPPSRSAIVASWPGSRASAGSHRERPWVRRTSRRPVDGPLPRDRSPALHKDPPRSI